MSTQHTGSSANAYTADTYVRRADHTPNTNHEQEDKYILTLHTDPEHHKAMTALRTQYFPTKLNKLSAHIALFRALPGSQLPTIESDILSACEQLESFPISTKKPFSLRQGVGINAEAPVAREIFAGLQAKWVDFLSQQDKSFRPHYTIQNKVEEEMARKTLEEVKRDFKGSRGWVDGLSLFRYDRGYWTHTRDFMFLLKDEHGL